MMYCIAKQIPLQKHEVDAYVETSEPMSNSHAFLTWCKDEVDFHFPLDGNLPVYYRRVYPGPGNRWTPETLVESSPERLIRRVCQYIDITELGEFSIVKINNS